MENQEVINYLLAHNDLKIIQRKDMFNFSLDTVLLSQFCTINKDVKNIVDWCNERHIGFYLEANSGMYCNDYMLEQGPETMVKYAKGKGASLENAKSSAQHFIDGFIHLQGDELYRDDVNKISFIFLIVCIPFLIFLGISSFAAIIVWYILLSLFTRKSK